MKRLFAAILAGLLLLQTSAGLAQESLPLDNPDGPDIVSVTSEARALKAGDEGEDVMALQARLRELLYYFGPLSGTFAGVTAKAVRSVQTAYGLPVTGIADMATQEIIYGDAHRPLERGSQGEDVKRLQTRLSELGYYWGQISGNYLDGTTAAIGNFQKDNGLGSTGRADIGTLEKVYSDDIVAPTPDPAATPAPLPQPTEIPDTSFPGRLGYGSTGRNVARLQEQLKYLGFFDRKVTSGYYTHTQAAVKAFQRLNGLETSGSVDEVTWGALFAADAVRPGGIPKPTAAPTPIPYFVEVDVANQLIKVYRRDQDLQFTDLYKVFTASTGTARYPSDVGTWTLTGRRARWATFPTWGGGYAQYWLRINANIAFHSVLYESTDPNSIKMSSVKALGRPASHGCIRLTVADAKWMYDNIKAGVEVWIHEDARPDPELKYASRPGAFDSGSKLHQPTPQPSAAPLYQAGVIPSLEVRTLKVGAEGEDVFWLQSRLKELGLYFGSITGQYREGTRDAVKAYQKANKLSQNGSADKKTLELLYQQTLALQPTAPAPLLTPLPSPTPDFTVG
ncbi:MAG: peptidoglycan-binding protein [Christensenellales bacterium]